MNSLTRLMAKQVSLFQSTSSGFAKYQNTRRMGHYKQTPYEKWDIVRGDNVVMNSGRDKGKSGKVLKVYRH